MLGGSSAREQLGHRLNEKPRASVNKRILAVEVRPEGGLTLKNAIH
jgi:hypothetical protein